MAELLDRVIKKRRLQIHGVCVCVWGGGQSECFCLLISFLLQFFYRGLDLVESMYVVHILTSLSSCILPPAGYELEKKDRPGLVVDLSSTLESQGTMDFILVKHIGTYVCIKVASLNLSIYSLDTYMRLIDNHALFEHSNSIYLIIIFKLS